MNQYSYSVGLSAERFPFFSNLGAEDAKWISEDAAEDFHSNRNGWESPWPVDFGIFSEHRELLGNYRVDRERLPSFSATAIEPWITPKSDCIERTAANSIPTYTGIDFWPLNPLSADIDIRDIAHALSLMCRFTGHTDLFYSVADHSLRVSRVAEQTVLKQGRTTAHLELAREMALWGLLHDASEAYLMDVPRPLKYTTGFGDLYKRFETKLMEAIINRFSLFPMEPAIVKAADRTLGRTEMRDLLPTRLDAISNDCLSNRIDPLDSFTAEHEFLRRFEVLTMARKVEQIKM